MRTHFVKRKLNAGSLEFSNIENAQGGNLRQTAEIIQGIDRELSQKINKEIKSSKLKVQTVIRGEELRISSNKRDILQEAISLVKGLDIKQPLQYTNFRD